MYDMESVSNTLDNSGCLQLVDKQGTPSGTRQHFPHEVNVEEEEEAKNMTAQGCKHPDKTTKETKHPQHVMDIREVRIMKSAGKVQDKVCQSQISLSL